MMSENKANESVQRRVYKLIVIGDSNVGKTCLTYRFCEGKFPKSTEATIGVDFRERIIKVDNEELKLQIWDTAGQERFRKSMVPHYYRNVHAVIFVYDVTRPESFHTLPHWIEECECQNLSGANMPRILVGNKCDEKHNQTVNTNTAQRFADAHNMPLFETSAKDDSQSDHVESIFLTVVHKLRASKPMMGPSYSAATDNIDLQNNASSYNNHSYTAQSDGADCYC